MRFGRVPERDDRGGVSTVVEEEDTSCLFIVFIEDSLFLARSRDWPGRVGSRVEVMMM